MALAHRRTLKLKRQGRLAEARDVLAEAVQRLGPAEPGEYAPSQAQRAFLIWMLGSTADELGDRLLAVRSFGQLLGNRPANHVLNMEQRIARATLGERSGAAN